MIAFEKILRSLRSHFISNALSALSQFPADRPEVEYATATSMGANGAGLALIEAALLHQCHGNVTTACSSILKAPVSNMAWPTDPADADAQVAVMALKCMRQAFSTISHITVGEELATGPKVWSDADILDCIREVSIPLYHVGATCAVGKNDDPGAVVGSQARVFGVSGLRVADMWAAPFTPQRHLQAIVYRFAETIADDVRKGIGKSS